jgi:F0F1-type ATP synthase assembly protein I
MTEVQRMKQARIACIISAIAVVISAITLFISAFDWPSITMFCGMVAVLCSCLAIYSNEKKRNNDDRK